jgi:hypothetical protein
MECKRSGDETLKSMMLMVDAIVKTKIKTTAAWRESKFVKN